MAGAIQDEIDAARAARARHDLEAAETGYARAAALARTRDLPLLLAYALRHVSDIARERGAPDRALAAGGEAVAIYRARPDSAPLDLANALRVNALASRVLQRTDEQASLWREARALYADLGVTAGVDECDANLPPFPER